MKHQCYFVQLSLTLEHFEKFPELLAAELIVVHDRSRTSSFILEGNVIQKESFKGEIRFNGETFRYERHRGKSPHEHHLGNPYARIFADRETPSSEKLRVILVRIFPESQRSRQSFGFTKHPTGHGCIGIWIAMVLLAIYGLWRIISKFY